MSKQRQILSFFGRENKQYKNKDPKPAELAAMTKMNRVILMNRLLNQTLKQGKTFNLPGWKKYKWLRYDNTKGMLSSICIESSKANPFTCGCTNYRTSTLSHHIESQDHQNVPKEVQMASNFQRAVVNSVTFQEKAVVSGLRTVLAR